MTLIGILFAASVLMLIASVFTSFIMWHVDIGVTFRLAVLVIILGLLL